MNESKMNTNTNANANTNANTNTNTNTTITNEEAETLKQLMQNDAKNDHQFSKLMVEYMNEISNPEHRAENEAYLRHLEENSPSDVPQGKLVIHPIAGFVLKFQMINKRNNENRNGDHHSRKLSGTRSGSGSTCSDDDDGTTTTTSSSISSSSISSSSTSKLFINIVHSEKIQEATHTRDSTGTHWTLPYSMGPIRMEYDAHKHHVQTMDCCFHTDVLKRACACAVTVTATTGVGTGTGAGVATAIASQSDLNLKTNVLSSNSTAFLDLIANVAREGAIATFEKNKVKGHDIGIEISLSYRVLKGFVYKSGDMPCIMLINKNDTGDDNGDDTGNDNGNDNGDDNGNDNGNDNAGSDVVGAKVKVNAENASKHTGVMTEKGKLNKDESDQTQLSNTSTCTRTEALLLKKGFLNSTSTSTSTSTSSGDKDGVISNTCPAGSSDSRTRKGGGKTKDGRLIPYYEVIEKGQFELLDLNRQPQLLQSQTSSTDAAASTFSRPEYLEYRITLHGVRKIQDLNLDVSDQRLVLDSASDSDSSSNSDSSGSNRYHLGIQLPYPVNEDRGRAQFNASKNLLTVTLSVQRS